MNPTIWHSPPGQNGPIYLWSRLHRGPRMLRRFPIPRLCQLLLPQHTLVHTQRPLQQSRMAHLSGSSKGRVAAAGRAKSPRCGVLGPTKGTPLRALDRVGEVSGPPPGSPMSPRPIAHSGLEGTGTPEGAPGRAILELGGDVGTGERSAATSTGRSKAAAGSGTGERVPPGCHD